MQVLGAGTPYDLGDAVPRVPRFAGHVDGVAGAESQEEVVFVVAARARRLGGGLWGWCVGEGGAGVSGREGDGDGDGVMGVAGGAAGRDHEETVASKTETDEALVRLLADVPVHHHGVAGGVKVDNGGLGARLGEEGLQEARQVGGERGRFLVRIEAVGPVVLAAEGEPVEAAGEDLLCGEWLVDGGILGEEARRGGWGGRRRRRRR